MLIKYKVPKQYLRLMLLLLKPKHPFNSQEGIKQINKKKKKSNKERLYLPFGKLFKSFGTHLK